MDYLSEKVIGKLPSSVATPSFNRSSVQCGILHFDVGNFHRAHQAIHFNNLLNNGHSEWGITGVSMRSAATRDALVKQDYLYAQMTLAPQPRLQVVGSLLNVLVAPEDSSSVIAAVSNPHTRVITTTITEKGYCLSSGVIDDHHDAIASDMRSLTNPHSLYGYLAAGLIRRRIEGGMPITVVCCDNISGGGNTVREGVQMLLRQHCAVTANWAESSASFCSSMVDRVVPATDDDLVHRVSLKLSVTDRWPVSAEPFSQWVIEDNFAGPRPPLDESGAVFVTNTAPYEQLKLRLLNAAHTLVAVLGYLADYQTIHNAMNDRTIRRFVRQALLHDAIPATPVPDGVNAEEYVESAIQRFGNECIPYSVLQVCSDSSHKIQQRLFPTIEENIKCGNQPGFYTFGVAAWAAYCAQAAREDELLDPCADDIQVLEIAAPGEFLLMLLRLAHADSFQWFSDERFMAQTEKHLRDILNLGLLNALGNFDSDDQTIQNHA